MEGFSQRLQQIIEHYGINAGILADRLSIQRSTLSHLFAGRNRPGFEFLEKLLAAFPDLNLNWVVSGQGEMIAGRTAVQPLQPVSSLPETPVLDLFQSPPQPGPDVISPPAATGKKTTVRVVMLYSDGTFDEYLK